VVMVPTLWDMGREAGYMSGPEKDGTTERRNDLTKSQLGVGFEPQAFGAGSSCPSVFPFCRPFVL